MKRRVKDGEQKNKKGQIQLSFGVIFSIIIIIATIAVAFYVIKYFLNVNKCTQIGLFYDSFQGEVDKAWNSAESSDVFNGKLPNGVNEVCFGNNTASINTKYKKEHDALKTILFSKNTKNIFLYPQEQSCSGAVGYYELKHADIPDFFCIDVVDGKVNIEISKGKFDALVKITKT